MATVSSFLDKHGKLVGDTLNNIILAIPSNILQMQTSPIRNVIVEICFKLIKTNPAFLDSRDYKGRIPIANLMNKILFEQFWQKVSETDILWNLIYELVTDKNVNIKDNDQVTPYTWILLWHESVEGLSKLDALEKQKLIKKIEEMKKHFQDKGASERDANQGLSTIRERQMEALLKRLVNLRSHMEEQLKRSGRSIKEIVAELEADVERVKDLKNKGCGECITELTGEHDFEKFVQYHMDIRNDRINRMMNATFEVLIVKENCLVIYDILLKKKIFLEDSISRIDYGDSFNPVLQLCLDKGSRPTIKEICELSLETMLRCKTSEALLGCVQMIKLLLGAYRKEGKTDSIEIYLNLIQDQYEVKEDLRIAAREVVRVAYGNLANCMQSESVINNLLFLRKDDGEGDIRKSFEHAENLMFLQADTRDPPFTKWMTKNDDDDDDEDDDDDDDYDYYDDYEKMKHSKLKKNLIKRNDNWLKRSILHLAAIFCHDGVLNYIPEDMIQKHLNAMDIHGCTPLHIAHLHDNKSAILFLESHGAKEVKDDFGRNPESPKCSSADCEQIYRDCCFGIVEAEYPVFDTMKKMNMLVLPVDECEVIGNQLKELFTQMVVDDRFLNAELVMAGSVREKLKVGSCDEFDLQICIKIRPYQGMPFACLRFHEYLVRRLIEVDKKGIYLRCISVGNPWILIWEGEGIYHGLEISVDVVPVIINDDALEENDKQAMIIENAPDHRELLHLKWRDLNREAHWRKTVCRHEWDILDNLPPGCRLGILISKALLQVLFHAGNRGCILSQEITSYLIKNVLFYLLVGQMPDYFERPHEEERYGALCQRLSFKTNPPKWTTAEDLERYAEEGRFWAEKIFDFILFAQRKYGKMISCFLLNNLGEKRFDDAVDVLVTCERCLELLKPEIFYSEDLGEEAFALPGGDSRLRKNLQEVINRVNEEAEKVPGGLLWKKKKDMERLKMRINLGPTAQEELETGEKGVKGSWEARDEMNSIKLATEIGEICLENAGELESELLKKQEGEFDALDSAINQILQLLGQANQKDSELFRLRGECEELEKSERNGKAALALSRKRQECKDLEEEREDFRNSAKRLLEELEKILRILGQANQRESELFRLRGECEELENSERSGEEDSALSRMKSKCKDLDAEREELRSSAKRLLEDLEKILQILGQANQRESELFRLRRECEKLENRERNGETYSVFSRRRWEALSRQRRKALLRRRRGALTRRRQECKDLEEQIEELRRSAKSLQEDQEKILQILGQASQRESELFRLRRECEELENRERNGETCSVFSRRRWRAWSRQRRKTLLRSRRGALTRKRQECKDLEDQIEELRSSAKSLLEELEKKVCHLSTEECIGDNTNEDPKDDTAGAKRRSDDTEEETVAKKAKSESAYHSNELKDTEAEDSAKCDKKRNSTHLEINERGCEEKEEDPLKKAKLEGIPDECVHANSNFPETEEPKPLHLPGYDPNDVLRGGELDITTMDKYALLCGLPTPSELHLRVTSSTPVTPEVDPSESFTAIHYVANHYVVSHQRNGRIMLYDSLYHGERIQQVLPQLACLYQIGGDASNIEYLVPQSQGATSDCGLFAAANATMLIHGTDPCTVTLDTLLLRIHMHRCLQDDQVRLFPTLN